MSPKYGMVSASLMAVLATIWFLVRKELLAAEERDLFETAMHETDLADMPVDDRIRLREEFVKQWGNRTYQNNELKGWNSSVRGSLGIKHWVFRLNATGWRMEGEYGAFYPKETGQCRAEIINNGTLDMVWYELPDTPPFVLMTAQFADHDERMCAFDGPVHGTMATTSPTILSRWGSHKYGHNIYPGNYIKATLMALPFSRSDEVERFLSYLVDEDKEDQHGTFIVCLIIKFCLVLAENKYVHVASLVLLTALAGCCKKRSLSSPLLRLCAWAKQFIVRAAPLGLVKEIYRRNKRDRRRQKRLDEDAGAEPIVGLERFAWSWQTTVEQCIHSLYAWMSAKWNEKMRLKQELERRTEDLTRASAALVNLEEVNKALQNERQRLAEKVQALEAKANSLEENVDALKPRISELEVQLNAAINTASIREHEMHAESDRLLQTIETLRQQELQTAVEREEERTLLGRKEEELNEAEQSLREERLINMSLNSAVEEMRRLILQIVEGHDAQHSEETTNTNAEDSAASQRLAPPPGFDSSSDVPVDPISNWSPNAMGLEDFMNTVYSTLFGLPQGYDDMRHLLRDLNEDAAIDGNDMAGRFGYQGLEAFLRSSAMASKVIVTASAEGRALYKARPNETNLHLHREQQIGFEYATNRRIKSAVNKAVAQQRAENDRLRSQLALTKDSMEKFKDELLKANMIQTHSRFRRSTPDERRPTTSRALLTPDLSLATADVSGDRLPRLSSLCSICFERPPDATVYKCGHCYCYQCIDDWRQTRAPTRTKGKEHTARPLCPSCRKPIEDIIRMYGK